jgi:4-hydroxy-2-oxoheptanedioate aldolase
MVKLKENKVKRALRRGEVCLGTMITTMRSPQIVSVLAASGWDFFTLDTEHNQFDMETLTDMMTVAQAEDIVPLIRVPDTQYHLMARPLDNGAQGLVCPRCESREQVEMIIRSTKYHPMGARGASLSGIHTGFHEINHAEYMKWANEETLMVIQIETKLAVDRVEELVSVPGVDAVWIGPFDLSTSMGLAGQFHHPEVEACYEKVIAACNKYSVAPGIHLGNLEALKRWIARGIRLAVYRSDSRLLMDASHGALAALRARA